MRVGIDCRLPTYRMGGISQYTIQLLRGLAQLDHAAEYVVYHSRKETGSFLPADQRFSRRNLWTPCHHLLERVTLAAELIGDRLDVFHSPDFIPPAAGARRRVITVHDLTFLRYPEFLTEESRRYYNDQIRWAVAQADAISADSEATRRDLIDLVGAPEEKVTTIHLAANPLFAEPIEPGEMQRVLEQYGVRPGFILHVGTLEPRKNIPMLLNAYRQLRQETGRDSKLVLVGGKGWLYDEIFSAIRASGLEDSVVHLTSVDDHSLHALYSAAALLAAPSFYEGFGLPVLEAMHVGCPVIASNCGSLPEVVGDAGILLEPTDTLSWVAALELVLSSSELAARMAAAGREQARLFSWVKTAEATWRLYQP